MYLARYENQDVLIDPVNYNIALANTEDKRLQWLATNTEVKFL